MYNQQVHNTFFFLHLGQSSLAGLFLSKTYCFVINQVYAGHYSSLTVNRACINLFVIDTKLQYNLYRCIKFRMVSPSIEPFKASGTGGLTLVDRL